MQTQVVYCFEKTVNWQKKVQFNININDENEQFFHHIIEFISRTVSWGWIKAGVGLGDVWYTQQMLSHLVLRIVRVKAAMIDWTLSLLSETSK